MVSAYKAMAEHMPDNGTQCVMFTHQTRAFGATPSAFSGSRPVAVAARYIATETTSELKKGGYVQGYGHPDAEEARWLASALASSSACCPPCDRRWPARSRR